MATLYIIRGVSGSGKSTLAREMSERLRCLYFEADMYFIQDNGEYVFDLGMLPAAHEWCFLRVQRKLHHGCNVIVSNTFTRLWEMRNYIDYAVNHNHDIHIITCTGRYQNVHGLSDEMVNKQRTRFQNDKEIAKELSYNIARYGRIVFSNHG